jgi:hypothetical protein
MAPSDKISWQGEITAVQPRIRLTRSFDQQSHTYLGYSLLINGTIAGHERALLIGIGKAARDKFRFRSGDVIPGESLQVADDRKKPVEFYKTAKLKILERAADTEISSPPVPGVAPPLEVYRQRGRRRLDARAYTGKCVSCIWGCRMPVEIIVDHWNPGKVKYRFETFCYGPKSCRLHHPGQIRKVPGRKGMVWEEEDWVGEDATAHRGEDE